MNIDRMGVPGTSSLDFTTKVSEEGLKYFERNWEEDKSTRDKKVGWKIL